MDTFVSTTRVEPTREVLVVRGMIPNDADAARMRKELEDFFNDLALEHATYEVWAAGQKILFDPNSSASAKASVTLHGAYLATGDEEDKKEKRKVTIDSPKVPPSLVVIEIRTR